MAAPAKLHHYVPQAYLKPFTNDAGRLVAYRKDDPTNPHLKVTKEVGAQNNYYTQPLPDGTLDRGLETFFQNAENLWPSLVESLCTTGQPTPDLIEPFFEFMGAMRVRGPASRDAAELAYAEHVRMAGELMERRGEFPSPPAGFEEALSMKNLVLSVDPHQSIHALPHMLAGFSRVIEHLGFCLVRNETTIDLITSDNPVVYFDPTMPEDRLRPYAIENGPPIELLFPITPKLLVVGHSDWAGPFGHTHFRQMQCTTPSTIRRANRYIARFGYREIYATNREHDGLVTKWASESPIISNTAFDTERGRAVITRWVFGPRPVKPKWKRSKPPSA